MRTHQTTLNVPKILPGVDQSKPMNAVRTTGGHWLVNADWNIHELMAQLKANGLMLVWGKSDD